MTLARFWAGRELEILSLSFLQIAIVHRTSHVIVVVLWICVSTVRRREQGETSQSRVAVDSAIISKCHWQDHYS